MLLYLCQYAYINNYNYLKHILQHILLCIGIRNQEVIAEFAKVVLLKFQPDETEFRIGVEVAALPAVALCDADLTAKLTPDAVIEPGSAGRPESAVVRAGVIVFVKRRKVVTVHHPHPVSGSPRCPADVQPVQVRLVVYHERGVLFVVPDAGGQFLEVEMDSVVASGVRQSVKTLVPDPVVLVDFTEAGLVGRPGLVEAADSSVTLYQDRLVDCRKQKSFTCTIKLKQRTVPALDQIQSVRCKYNVNT